MSEPMNPMGGGDLGGPASRPDGAGFPPNVGGGVTPPGGSDTPEPGMPGEGDIGGDVPGGGTVGEG